MGPANVAMGAQSATFLAGDRDLFIAAHEDDDLLFESPDLAARIQAGDTVRTVFLTAGDAGRGLAYALEREAGSRAAYARLAGAGIANTWTASDLPLGDKLIRIYTLDAAPNLSVAFLRLPDGNAGTGSGYPVTGYQSLERLWEGRIAGIASLDRVNIYTKAELILTLFYLMMDFQPQHIQTQDASNLYGNDHPDHRYGARFAFEAHQLYAATGAPHSFSTYRGYNISNEPANLTQAERDAKWAVFLTYAHFDSALCGGTGTGCLIESVYNTWSYRQYSIAQVTDLFGAIGASSGGCLSAGANLSDGTAPAIVNECLSDGEAQTWSINADGSLTASDGRCLEVRGGLPEDGTPAQLAACAGTPEQRWTAFQNGQVRGLAGKCLDVAGGNPADGTPVLLNSCAALPEQQWSLPLGSAPPTPAPDFSIAFAPGFPFTQSVAAGGSVTYTLAATPRGFAGTIWLACRNAPPDTTCTSSPSPLTLDGQDPANVQVTVTTALSRTTTSAFDRWPGRTPAPAPLFFAALLGLLISLTLKRWRLFGSLALFAVLLWAACGGGTPGGEGPGSGTSPGTYSLTLVATSGNLTRSVPVILKVR